MLDIAKIQLTLPSLVELGLRLSLAIYIKSLLLLLDSLANVTVGEAHELADPEENTPATLSCRQSTWQCVSKAIEGSLHYVDSPEGITR